MKVKIEIEGGKTRQNVENKQTFDWFDGIGKNSSNSNFAKSTHGNAAEYTSCNPGVEPRSHIDADAE